MTPRERARKHDDAHRPMGGRGKRATRPVDVDYSDMCPYCELYPRNYPHLCAAAIRGSHD
jgi:hypothetical protein